MNDIVCWWSGGITSAYACYLAKEKYGVDRCRFIFIDTHNEDEDTYRFMKDCSVLYGKEIETICSDKFYSVQDVWERYLALNHATGAVCSTMLKREVRIKWEKSNTYTHQVFGFEYNKKEINRYTALLLSYPKSLPIAPLIDAKVDKEDAIAAFSSFGIPIPRAYNLGYNNNNCLKTGCVQGGIGYWKKMKVDRPTTFMDMAMMEHKLTDLKGSPVTMLLDQSKKAKQSGNTLVFLVKHKDYPDVKCLDDMKGRKVKPLVDCNGFCGIDDMNEVNNTTNEINYDESTLIIRTNGGFL